MTDVAELLGDIRELVECESPSSDDAALAASADRVAELGTRLLGVAPERLGDGGGHHLLWRFGRNGGVLLLGHHDTVWPIGSWPEVWTEQDGRVSGPGIFDMKTGIVLALHAVAALEDRDGVAILITSDEELGSPGSRDLIRAEARRAGSVLVLEAAADGGALKTARRGISTYRITATGRAAHAGLEPERGINASVELAHQILEVERIGTGADGATVVPTLLAAGTTTNTVPALGTLSVDVRGDSAEVLDAVDRRLRSLTAVLPGAEVGVERLFAVPPLERASSAELYDLATRLSAELGLPTPTEIAVGGASDGNTAAAAGARVLDGLGAIGGNAHAPGEYLEIATLPARLALIAALVAALAGRTEEAA